MNKQMKTACLFLSVFFLSFLSSSQNQNTKKFNLDFEEYNRLLSFPYKWFKWGKYHLEADTLHVHSGKFSGKISSGEKVGSFGSIAYAIPANYEGKSVQLEGYMKIKNVENGFAGLLLRIDGESEILVFDNMKDQNINGTKDWQKHKITLPYPDGAKTIFVAGILAGKGEAWFDDFVLTIDGKNIQTLKEIEKPILKANLDKTFDLGSNVTFQKLDDKHITNLDLLGKVWGFLKYHHPEIAKGNYNWDYELFRILPEYNQVKTNVERDALLLNWIDNLGKVEPCKLCKDTTENAFVKPDHAWINVFGLSAELKNKLNHIYKNKHQGSGFYIGIDKYDRIKFTNENPYPLMTYPDSGFRLLSLYRYWNMMQYFFPYKYLTDKDWNTVLKEYIPKFIKAKNELEYELVATKLIGEINDTHANLWGGNDKVHRKRGEYYPPFKLRFIENKFVVTDYYNPEFKAVSKVKAGDVITHINERPVTSIVDSISPYYPASNKTSKLRDISRDLLRSNKKEISIKFISNNQNKQHRLPLYEKGDLNLDWYKWEGECYKILDGNIGYITLQFIKKEDIPAIKEAFKDTKGIIIDIRNYPSTFVPFLLGTYFVSENRPFAKFTRGNINNPGEFILEKGVEIPKPKETYKGKLVVLINEDSQSQSEYTAMAFRAGDNTTIVGSTTAGADGNVARFYLPGGLLTRISGIGVYYPNGTETQRVGIIPDIEVKPTIEGIKNGIDEPLQKAIEIINNN